MLSEFLYEYGGMIVSTVITAVLGAIGVLIKNLYKKAVNDKTKREVVKTCVLAVEQLYKDIHGEEKYNKCVESIVEMLNEKGITITELEIKLLIEAEVKKLNLWKDDENELSDLSVQGDEDYAVV